LNQGRNFVHRIHRSIFPAAVAGVLMVALLAATAFADSLAVNFEPPT
jgi:hypothetical protein